MSSNLKVMIALAPILFTGTAMAGVSTFIGEGHVSHPAEYIELSVTVHSKCFADINDARNATNSAAQRVLDLMKTKLDPENSKDAAFTSGGTTTRETRVNNISQICRGSFSKTTKITLLSSDVANFESNFSDVEDLVYSDDLSLPSNGVDAPTTYAVISTPIARIYSETIVILERKALTEAIKNAKYEFQILIDHSCGVSSYQITKTEEPNARNDSFSNPYAGTRGTPRRGSSSTAPVSFSDIWVSKGLNVEFTFEGGRCEVSKMVNVL